MPALSRASALAIASALVVTLPLAAKSERELPEKFRKSPYHLMSLSVGHPDEGFQVRAKKLKKSPYLAVKLGSEASVYGHPALVLMLKRTAREIARASVGSRMLVGDLSAKEGGPLTGHRSHQSGRDADVGFYARTKAGAKHTSSSFVAFDGDGSAKDGSGLVFDDHRNWLLVHAWLTDDRAGISHIFVSTALRIRLLKYAASKPKYAGLVEDAAALLAQPEGSSPHDDHFHVRISCPAQQDEICREHSTR